MQKFQSPTLEMGSWEKINFNKKNCQVQTLRSSHKCEEISSIIFMHNIHLPNKTLTFTYKVLAGVQLVELELD